MMDVAVGVGACWVDFRPIPECSLYLLGSDGTVWTCSVPGSRRRGPWRRRKLNRTAGGSLTIGLWRDDGTIVVRSIRRLLREVFPPVDADEEDEEDGRPDPRASFGEDSGRAKLTWAQVRELRRLKAEGATYEELAGRFGIHRRTVHAILRGETWAVLPPDLPDPVPNPGDVATAPASRPEPVRRRGRRPRHGALRERPGDRTPLEELEVPRRSTATFQRPPLDEAEVLRLHAEGWSFRELIARFRVRPNAIGAILKGASPAAGCAQR
jgi:hypothetical protein